ncbi:unnamed protein product [Blepharisma stoltei]|uniref:Uncharacterized protein n=1 Tax=Blepharisma stoltei TaxID=1481888 RepID=A0AAU9JYJ0_9CILI|nr:unnamed protein product [Blepharisma stoltei]
MSNVADLHRYLKETRENRKQLIALAKKYIKSEDKKLKKNSPKNRQISCKNCLFPQLNRFNNQEIKLVECPIIALVSKPIAPLSHRIRREKSFLTPNLKEKYEVMDYVYSKRINRPSPSRSFQILESRNKNIGDHKRFARNRSSEPNVKIYHNSRSHRSTTPDFDDNLKNKKSDPFLWIQRRRMLLKEKLLIKSPTSLSCIN